MTETAFLPSDLDRDRSLSAHLLGRPGAELDALPPKPDRSPVQRERAEQLLAEGQALRDDFLARHAAAIYDELTEGRSLLLRASDLVYRAADAFPGLTPGRQLIAAERE